jgi:8-oxo-dGTP pyrophosphatase MutT (NUDIX family)
MSLLRHVTACNRFDPARFLPLLAGEATIGLVRRDNAAALAPFRDVFVVGGDAVRLVATGGFDAVTAAVDEIVERLVESGRVPKWRNESFAVTARWGEKPLFKIDRGVVNFFGIRSYGVHVNGIVRDGGMRLWIGKRAADKKVAPGKLDNLIGGGIGHGHGVFETLVKEADEEAGLPAELARRSVPVGALSYRMENHLGVRNDALFVYDLELPRDFVPRNKDGEIVEFRLEDAAAVLERVRRTDDFKFNVNLVIIDLAIRHGLLTPDDPEYLDLVTGLRRPLR